MKEFLHKGKLLFHLRIAICEHSKHMVMIEIHVEAFGEIFKGVVHGVTTHKSHRTCVLFSCSVVEPADSIELDRTIIGCEKGVIYIKKIFLYNAPISLKHS